MRYKELWPEGTVFRDYPYDCSTMSRMAEVNIPNCPQLRVIVSDFQESDFFRLLWQAYQEFLNYKEELICYRGTGYW